MRIEIFGYYVHVLLFVIIFAVILVGVLSFILIRRLKERKQVYTTSRITDWEKNNIPKLLRKEIDSVNDADYTNKINKIINYIQTCDYWNNDELIELDKDSILLITSILFDYVKENHSSNPDKCVLLLHTIDNANGGIDFSNGNNWMSEDFQMQKNSGKMSDDESRAILLCQNAVTKAYEKYINTDTDAVPLITKAIPELSGKKYEQFQSAVDDIAVCKGFDSMKESTYNMTEICLIDEIDKFIEVEEDDYFDEYYLCYFRVLASLIDRQPYDEILESLAD